MSDRSRDMASDTVPQTMRAFTIPKHGPVSLIEMSTLPTPKPSPSELLVKIEYVRMKLTHSHTCTDVAVIKAGVNFIDTYQREGVYPNTSWPMILGGEAAGEVVQLPTDPEVLQDSWYRQGSYQIGTKVHDFLTLSTSCSTLNPRS